MNIHVKFVNKNVQRYLVAFTDVNDRDSKYKQLDPLK